MIDRFRKHLLSGRHGRRGVRSGALSRRRPGLDTLENRTLLTGGPGVDLGDYYLVAGQRQSVLRSTDQLLIGLEPGVTQTSLDPLMLEGGALAGATIQPTTDASNWVVNLSKPLEIDALDALRAQVEGAAGVAYAAETFVGSDRPDHLLATNSIVVALAPGASAADLFAGPSFGSYRPLRGTTDQYVVQTTAAPGPATVALANQLQQGDARVHWATPDFFMMRQTEAVNDPLYTQQWHLLNTGQNGGTIGADVNVQGAWNLGITGKGVTIAVLDVGFQLDHPDLVANLFRNTAEIAGDGIDNDGNGYIDDVTGWDFWDNDNNPSPGAGDDHGTAVAGVAAAVGNNSLGVASPAYEAKWIPVRIPLGVFAPASVYAEAEYYGSGRAANGVTTFPAGQVLNHSYGGGFPTQVEQDAFAWSATQGRNGRGAVNFASSGNGAGSGYTPTPHYPSGYPSVLSVGGTTEKDVRVSYSEFGPNLAFVTPTGGFAFNGIQNIVTTDRTGANGYDPGDYTGLGATGFNGTSSASPLAAGVGALVMQANPALTFAEIRQALFDTADQVGGVVYDASGFNLEYGHGRLNAGNAVLKVAIQLQATSPAGIKENQDYIDVTVGQFVFAQPPTSVSEFTASVSIAGGLTTPVPLVDRGGGRFDLVVPALSFAEGGKYPIVMTTYRNGTVFKQVNSTINVADLPINPFGVTLSFNEGDHFTSSDGYIARFEDTDLDTLTADLYSADIFWSDDGTTTPGTVKVDPSGGHNRFIVEGDHVFGGGTPPILVTITGPGGTKVIATSTAIVEDSALEVEQFYTYPGVPIEGQDFDLPVIRFIDLDPRKPPASNYTATIDWGDGTQSTGVVSPDPNGGGFLVSGNHSYSYSIQPYPVNVTVKQNNGGDRTAQATGLLSVSDAPLSAFGLDYAVTEGVKFDKYLVSFADADPRNNPTGHYHATIEWGDGTRSETVVGSADALVVRDTDGGYLIRGSHAYRLPGSFSYTVIIAQQNGDQTAQATGTLVVPPAPITATVQSQAAPLEGQRFTGVVASFTTANALAQAGDYHATIRWGDGTSTTNATVERDPTTGRFLVRGAKAYEKYGNYSVSVEIDGPGNQVAGAGGQIKVLDAPLSPAGTTLSLTSKQDVKDVVVASFNDGNPNPTAADFSAAIAWGDGTTSQGTIRPNGRGGFDIVGSHRYDRSGHFLVKATIQSQGGSQATASTTANVSPKMFPLSGSLASTIPSQGSSTPVNTPTFSGHAEPGAKVDLFAIPTGTMNLVSIGSGEADSSGAWTATSSMTLPDGSYSVVARASDAAGDPSSAPTFLLPTPSGGPLTIDTQGPKVQGVQVDPATGRVLVSLADSGTGLNYAGLINASNFTLTVLGGTTNRVLRASGITVSPASPGALQTATISFAGLGRLNRGSYVLQISAPGVTDGAGNPLDERYYIPFPGIYTRSGQNFVGQFRTNGRIASPLGQYIPQSELSAAQRYRQRFLMARRLGRLV